MAGPLSFAPIAGFGELGSRSTGHARRSAPTSGSAEELDRHGFVDAHQAFRIAASLDTASYGEYRRASLPTTGNATPAGRDRPVHSTSPVKGAGPGGLRSHHMNVAADWQGIHAATGIRIAGRTGEGTRRMRCHR
jgi:hypothetical protein